MHFPIFSPFFPFSLTWGPMGTKNVKTPHGIALKLFQTSPESSSQYTPQKHSFGFLKLRFRFFTFFFSALVNTGPYGSKYFKTPLFPHIAFKLFQTSPEFSSQWTSQNYWFSVFRFITMFFVFVFFFVCLFVLFCFH